MKMSRFSETQIVNILKETVQVVLDECYNFVRTFGDDE
jgi:hypothetical protein